MKTKTTPNLQGCGRTGYTSTHNGQNNKKAGTPKNKNHGQNKNHGNNNDNEQDYAQPTRVRQTKQASPPGFIFYVFTKHPTTLNVVSRATDPEQEVIGPVKKWEQRGLDKNYWEF